MIPIGTLDRVTAIIGERGVGKSTLAKIDAREFQNDTGGYVIGHSPNGQIGPDSDIEFHSDMEKLQRALKRRPGVMQIMTRGSPEEVLAYGDALALAIRRKAFRREYPLTKWREDRPAPIGLAAPPVLVLIDEGVAMKRHPSQDELSQLERLLTSARHKHLAVTWQSQAPTARQWVLAEQANRIRVFRYVHEWGANAIRAAGIPREVIPSLRELPKFLYFEFDKLNPELARYRALPPPGKP